MFVLAATGLLDDRRATTRWMYVERLRRRYPRVRIDSDVLYVADDNVMTSAGTTTGHQPPCDCVNRTRHAVVGQLEQFLDASELTPTKLSL